MIRRRFLGARSAALVGVVLCAVTAAGQQVTFERLLRPEGEPQNWLTYSGNFANLRHSLLTEITPANAANLELKWVWQSRSFEKFEATPLVVDGVLYTLQGPPVQGGYQVVALDAVTGRPFWSLDYRPADGSRAHAVAASAGASLFSVTRCTWARSMPD